MSGNPAHRPPLVNFASLVTHSSSLLICGHIMPDDGTQAYMPILFPSLSIHYSVASSKLWLLKTLIISTFSLSRQVNIPSLKDNVQLWMKDHHVKGFYSALQSPTMSDGARSMMSLSGLGKVNNQSSRGNIAMFLIRGLQ